MGHLRDIDRLRREIQVTQPDFHLPRGSVQEIHDTLARIHRRLQHENRPIPSATDPKHDSLEQSLLCPTFGLLQFRRACWTHDLVEVSEGLHNCVSGYVQSALLGEVIIVVARDAQNVPRACLEIRGRSVVQYKLDHNEPPSTAEDLSTAAAYVQLAELSVKGSDLREVPRAAVEAALVPPVVPEPDPVDLPF